MNVCGVSISGPELIAVSLAAGWVFSAFSYALPVPTEKDGRAYVVFYRLVHFAAANIPNMKGGGAPRQPDPALESPKPGDTPAVAPAVKPTPSTFTIEPK